MGLFGSFLKGIGRAIGRGIESVGNVVETATGFSGIANFGRSVREACTEKVSRERSYERRTANIHSTERLSEILVSFSDGYLQQAKTIENASIRMVEDYYDKLLELLEGSFDTSSYGAGMKRLKSARERIRRTIEGSVRNPLARRMSLDDPECLGILKMDAGKEKGQAMSRFSQKVIQEALKNTSDQVRLSLDEQIDGIEDYLNGLQEQQEKEFRALTAQYEQLLVKGEKEAADWEKSCLEAAVLIEEARLTESLL